MFNLNQTYFDAVTTYINQHRDLALTMGGVLGGVGVSIAFNLAAQHRHNARIRKNAYKNHYNIEDVYVTQTYYQKSKDINPETENFFWDQVTDPHFFDGNDEIHLGNIFHQSTGDVIVDAIKRTLKKHKDEPIIFLRLKDKYQNPKNDALWSHKKRPWVLFFRSYMGSIGRAERMRDPLQHQNERFKEHSVYPVLIDEPNAVHRQGKVILITQEQLDQGLDALPAVDDVRILKDGVFQHDPEHHMMERYKTLRHAIQMLNTDPWLANAIRATYLGTEKEEIFDSVDILNNKYSNLENCQINCF